MLGNIFSVYILGIAILIGAILMNILATNLGLTTWYDFLKNPQSANGWSYLWLILFYPLGLGVIAICTMTLYKI